jgi:hypothetical protein
VLHLLSSQSLGLINSVISLPITMKISFLFIVSMSLGVAHAARVRSGLVAEDNLVAQAETVG